MFEILGHSPQPEYIFSPHGVISPGYDITPEGVGSCVSRTNADMSRVKRKSALEHAQNPHNQIILRMCIVSSEPLLSIHTFCSIK